MEAEFLCLSLFSLIVLVARWCRTTDPSLGASEEAAHAAALRKRIQSECAAHPEWRCERRCKTTQNATAKILGLEASVSPCHIINISSSGMRIKWSAPVPADSQIQVQWGDHYFIGSMGNHSRQFGSKVIALRVNACNYIQVPWRWRLACLSR